MVHPNVELHLQKLLLIIDNLYNIQFLAFTLSCKQSTHLAIDIHLYALNCRAFSSPQVTYQNNSTINIDMDHKLIYDDSLLYYLTLLYTIASRFHPYNTMVSTKQVVKTIKFYKIIFFYKKGGASTCSEAHISCGISTVWSTSCSTTSFTSHSTPQNAESS